MVPRLLAIALFACCSIPAQDPRAQQPKPKPEASEVKEPGDGKGGEKPDDGSDGKIAAGGVVGTPAEPVIGSRGYCRIEVAVRPGRLLPGQSGTAIVTMMLEGDAVMTWPTTVDVQPVVGGPLQFGAATMAPPDQARLAKFFRGQQVYDNWAVLQLPVTMALGVPLGSKQSTVLNLSFDLADGTTGQPIGRFTERAPVSVEVGTVKDPQVRIPDLHGQAEASGAANTTERRDQETAATLASQGPASQPQIQPEVVPMAPPDPRAKEAMQKVPTENPAVETDDEEAALGGEVGSSSLLLYVAGGALLVILALTMKAKK